MKDTDIKQILESEAVEKIVYYVYKELKKAVEKWALDIAEAHMRTIMQAEGVSNIDYSHLIHKELGIGERFSDDSVEAAYIYDIANHIIKRTIKRTIKNELSVSYESKGEEKYFLDYVIEVLEELKNEDKIYTDLAQIYKTYRESMEDWFSHDKEFVEELIYSVSTDVARTLKQKQLFDIKDIVVDELKKSLRSENFKHVLNRYFTFIMDKLDSLEKAVLKENLQTQNLGL